MPRIEDGDEIDDWNVTDQATVRLSEQVAGTKVSQIKIKKNQAAILQAFESTFGRFDASLHTLSLVVVVTTWVTML